MPFSINHFKKDHFYQDRVGTKTGKVEREKGSLFSAGLVAREGIPANSTLLLEIR
jgi:hypothetical protein